MNLKESRTWLFYTAIIVSLWLKTYLVQRFVFELTIQNKMQEFILFISPLFFILLLFGFSLFIREKLRNKIILFFYILLSFILYANVVYYRFFHDFITLPLLFQTKNMGDLGGSIQALIKGVDVFFFVDVIVLSMIMFMKKIPYLSISKAQRRSVFVFAAITLVVNLSLAEIQRPQLLTRSFDREMLVKNLGLYSYQLYDVYLQSKTKTQKVFANTNQFAEIENYVRSNHHNPNSELFGVAKGKNVIIISLESVQSFVINNKMNGYEITPFLNELIKNSFYFENFYHQTGQGKTSDAEFMVNNSLYPLPRGSVFFTHANNEYNALPEIIKKNNYYSAVFHANDKTFWNRNLMYDSLHYDQFFSKEFYEVTEENSVGWGLKDIEFFEQSIPYLKELPRPFYAKFITLTNHHPYLLGEEDRLIPEYDSSSRTLNRYFPTVRYSDEALRIFFEQLIEEGLYEDSIIIIYGDHYGISQNHNDAMSQYLGKEITPFETVQLQRVPFIVHIPGMEGKTISTVAGQIDIKPTILHLLGIKENKDIAFGSNLFAKERDSFAVLRDGSFITDEYIYTNNTCYSKETEEEVDSSYCEPYQERADTDLKYSDEIIYGDLLRFFEKEESLEHKQLAK